MGRVTVYDHSSYGYTGSDGFEIFTDIEEGRALWDRLINNDLA